MLYFNLVINVQILSSQKTVFPSKLCSFVSRILSTLNGLTASPLPEDKDQLGCLEEFSFDAFFLLSLLTYNLSTHLKQQIRHRLMSQSPSPERVVLGGCTLISYTLVQTEKELCGAEMLLLLAKLIHLHGTLSPWQFHNKS